MKFQVTIIFYGVARKGNMAPKQGMQDYWWRWWRLGLNLEGWHLLTAMGVSSNICNTPQFIKRYKAWMAMTVIVLMLGDGLRLPKSHNATSTYTLHHLK